MVAICDFIDSLLEDNYEIERIIEMTSDKFGFIKYPIAWYALIRKYKPITIVETGVSMGWSSFMILTALKREGKGKLYSIDLDDSESVRKGGGVGYMIPDYLKAIWNITIGDSKQYLGSILEQIGQIDMFIHDSDHSYETMSWEYNLAWKHLKQNGILCSDDINHSTAFDEFVERHSGEISHVYSFMEIPRNSDNENLRPRAGFLIKITPCYYKK